MKTKKTKKNTHEKKNKEMIFGIIKEKYVDPFTDFGFKKLFGEECNNFIFLQDTAFHVPTFLRNVVHSSNVSKVCFFGIKSGIT